MTAPRAILGIRSAPERERIGTTLVSLGYEVTAADSVEQLCAEPRAPRPRLFIADSGFVVAANGSLFAHWRDRMPGVPMLVLPDGHAAGRTMGSAGAFAAPSLDELDRVVAALRRPADAEGDATALDPLIGRSQAIRALAGQARIALGSPSPLLIEGETGSGKGVLAAWLHRHGPRAAEPFVDLNCAGFSRELMDSELFGHEKGAFTGAVSRKPGLVEVANGGTLFLDEIGDMDVAVQAKLLKVIEDQRFRRVGEVRERRADVRIIAATHHNLARRVREGLFREDLYFRLDVLRLCVPPLRHRQVDVPALAACILARMADELRRRRPALTPAAQAALATRPWPGNVRELRNELERALLACGDGPIDAVHFGPQFGVPAAAEDGGASGTAHPTAAEAGGTLRQVERAFIQRVFEEEGHHVERAALRLGIARSTFYHKLRIFGLSPRR